MSFTNLGLPSSSGSISLPHLSGHAPSFTETSSSATKSFRADGEVARKRMTKKFSTLLKNYVNSFLTNKLIILVIFYLKVTSARIQEFSLGESRWMLTFPGRPRKGQASTSRGVLFLENLERALPSDEEMIFDKNTTG